MLCKILGHKWKYHISSLNNLLNNRFYRHCQRCNVMEQWRTDIPIYKGWLRLTSLTKKHGKILAMKVEKTIKN